MDKVTVTIPQLDYEALTRTLVALMDCKVSADRRFSESYASEVKSECQQAYDWLLEVGTTNAIVVTEKKEEAES